MASYSDELMKVVIFLLLDWLLIRRNALSSSSVCFSFRRHPSGKYGGYSSASHCTGSAGMSGQDYFGIGGTGGGAGGGGIGGGSGGGAGGAGPFGHHKRSTNLILSV
uniref:Glycine-rich cell wall structural protein 1 n=1 Tax=Globodera pallida TaxID=36090 RepID=A0A183BIA0_GLOPA